MRIDFIIKLYITFFLLTSLIYSQHVWQKYAYNPVLPTWSGAVDEPNGYQNNLEQGILYDSTNNIFHMWFSSLTFHSGAKLNISEAMSFNGTDWYNYTNNPVVLCGANGAFDEQVRSPKVIEDATGFKMYYTCVRNEIYCIGMATSSDGKTWTKYPSNPVLTAGVSGSWDDVNVAFCSVVFDSTKSDSSRYMMWFGGGQGAATNIGLATSSDGIVWTEYSGNPVFIPGISGWDRVAVFEPAILKVNGYYHMFYLGNHGGTNSVGWAYSPDGMNWTRGDTLPVLTAGGQWEQQIGDIDVKFINNKFHMWYSGYSGAKGWQVGYATSEYDSAGVSSAFQLSYNTPLHESYVEPIHSEADSNMVVRKQQRER